MKSHRFPVKCTFFEKKLKYMKEDRPVYIKIRSPKQYKKEKHNITNEIGGGNDHESDTLSFEDMLGSKEKTIHCAHQGDTKSYIFIFYLNLILI